MSRLLSILVFFLFFLQKSQSQENIFDACREGNIEVVKKLYNLNKNSINALESEGYSPLVLACYYGHEDIVKFLADKVNSLNTETSYGSPLMAATVKGNTNIVSILLANNANPNITDDKGVTAAHYAVLFKNYDIIEQLFRAKADFSIKNNLDKSALDYAIDHKDERINKILQL